MPSSYTTNVAIEKPADGEQNNSWGDTVNDNMDILDRILSQVGSIALTGTTYTLTTSTSGSVSEGHYSVIKFTGSPGGTCTVTVSPNSIQRIYTIYNTSDQTVTMSQGSGTTVSVPAGEIAQVYCDGTGTGASVVTLTAALKDVLYDSNIGSTVQAYDADLAAIAALAKTDGNFIVGNGSTWVVESGNTALTSLGVTATAAELNTMDGITASTASLNTASTHYVPSGGIIMWSGSVASVPSGWYLCDGTNGTPNLTGKFVVHADADTGGTYAPGDTGGADEVTLTEAQMPSHTHSASTGAAGAHSHEVKGQDNAAGPTGATSNEVANVENPGSGVDYFSRNTTSVADHTHSVTIAATGGGTAHENRPPYYALAYIMKA